MEQHLYLLLLSLTLFLVFFAYGFIYDHKDYLSDNESLVNIFRERGLTAQQISKLTHDDSEWYYNGNFLCVAYGGEPTARCRRFETFCSGTDGKTFGTLAEQADEIKKAIEQSSKTKNNGRHPECPLLF
jgi:hypothetical protein